MFILVEIKVHTTTFDTNTLSLDEPTTIAGGGYNYRHPNIIKQVEEIVDDGVSVIALDEDDHLIGIMLAHTGY